MVSTVLQGIVWGQFSLGFFIVFEVVRTRLKAISSISWEKSFDFVTIFRAMKMYAMNAKSSMKLKLPKRMVMWLEMGKTNKPFRLFISNSAQFRVKLYMTSVGDFYPSKTARMFLPRSSPVAFTLKTVWNIFHWTLIRKTEQKVHPCVLAYVPILNLAFLCDIVLTTITYFPVRFSVRRKAATAKYSRNIPL